MLLYFGGAVMGDVLLDCVTSHVAEVPAQPVPGIGRSLAGLANDGRNLLYTIVCGVKIKRSLPADLLWACHAIQIQQGTSGIVQIKTDHGAAVRVLTDSSWILRQCQRPSIREGFGGRIVDRLEIEFVGTTAPTDPSGLSDPDAGSISG